MYLIKEASEWSGVSIRTLHHYDEMGLLTPDRASNGYRYYSDQDLEYLQIILSYKYLGIPLLEIKELLREDSDDQVTRLKQQLVMMKEEKERVLTIIETLEHTIQAKEKGIKMSNKDRFKGLSYQDKPEYKQEAIEKYGEEVVEESYKRHEGQENKMVEGFNEIFSTFAANHFKGIESTDPSNIERAEKLHQHICHYAFDCSLEVFGKIGQGYVDDECFKKNIDQFGEGTAEYVHEAIQAYVALKG